MERRSPFDTETFVRARQLAADDLRWAGAENRAVFGWTEFLRSTGAFRPAGRLRRRTYSFVYT